MVPLKHSQMLYIYSSLIDTTINCLEGQLRLLGPNPREGLLQICGPGRWVQFGGAGWSDSEAQVACRQMGYSAQGKYVIIMHT